MLFLFWWYQSLKRQAVIYLSLFKMAGKPRQKKRNLPTSEAATGGCSSKFRKFHWKTLVLESLLDKVADLQAVIKKRNQCRCFPSKHLFWRAAANDCFCSLLSSATLPTNDIRDLIKRAEIRKEEKLQYQSSDNLTEHNSNIIYFDWLIHNYEGNFEIDQY